MECVSFKKKVGGSKVLHSQSREIVANVYTFMKQEAEHGGAINLNRVQSRVSQATGVSVSSIKRILKEEKTCTQSCSQFSTPNKKRIRKRPKTDIDDFDICVVRRTVNEFHLTNGERPTITSVLGVLKERINFVGGKWALLKILKRLGFRWRKSNNNRKVLIEKSEIREMRLKYLRSLEKYRKEGRPVIYMDETYVHSSHTKPKAWTDDSGAGLKSPVSKGSRIIIVHAGNENGFVPNALITFQSGKKSGDYHHDMNYENYEKWIKTKLIPNIPPNSVMVIDNAPYHNVQLNLAPRSSSRKGDMIKWLSERGIPFSNAMMKPELYSIIKINKPKYKMYKIDAILAESGHSVLRLPPYHPDLNPIELIWSLLKANVARKNVLFSMEAVQKLVESTCQSITSEDWLSRCNHCKTIEEAYMELEPHIDSTSDQIIITLAEDSDSESDNTSDSETGSDTSGGSDIDGIQPL
jgi:hypothetical protein